MKKTTALKKQKPVTRPKNGMKPFTEPKPLVSVIGPIEYPNKDKKFIVKKRKLKDGSTTDYRMSDIIVTGEENFLSILLPEVTGNPSTLGVTVRAYFAHTATVTGGFTMNIVGPVSSFYFADNSPFQGNHSYTLNKGEVLEITYILEGDSFIEDEVGDILLVFIVRDANGTYETASICNVDSPF